MICLSELIDLHVFQMKHGKKVGKTTGFAARIGGRGIDALTLLTGTGKSRLLKLDYVKSVGAFGLTIDQENAFISEDEISDFLLFDMQALRRVIVVDEHGQFLGTILDMEWLPEELQMKSFILLDEGEKVKIFYPNISVMGQDMIVLNVRFPQPAVEQEVKEQVLEEQDVKAQDLKALETGVQPPPQETVVEINLASEKKPKAKVVPQRKARKASTKQSNVDVEVPAKQTRRVSSKRDKTVQQPEVEAETPTSAVEKQAESEMDMILSTSSPAHEITEQGEWVHQEIEEKAGAKKKKVIEEKKERKQIKAKKSEEKLTDKATIVKKNEQNLQIIQAPSFHDFSHTVDSVASEPPLSSSKEMPLQAEGSISESDSLEAIVEISAQDVTEAVQQEFPDLSQLEKGILEKQIHILLNKRLTAPIFTSGGDLMFEAGTPLTLERILKVQRMSPLLILDCAQNIES